MLWKKISLGPSRQSGAIPYSASFPLWWSLDFNVNPTCSLIGQTVIAKNREQIRVLDELMLPDSNTLAVHSMSPELNE
jgi:hypothetical protein